MLPVLSYILYQVSEVNIKNKKISILNFELDFELQIYILHKKEVDGKE